MHSLILINPKIKAVIISKEYIDSCMSDAQLDVKGNSTLALIKSVFEKINKAKINGGKVKLSDGKTYTIKKTK